VRSERAALSKLKARRRGEIPFKIGEWRRQTTRASFIRELN
jgi:hypothetical protein